MGSWVSIAVLLRWNGTDLSHKMLSKPVDKYSRLFFFKECRFLSRYFRDLYYRSHHYF